MNISDARGSDYFFNSFVSNSVPPKKSLAEAGAKASTSRVPSCGLTETDSRFPLLFPFSFARTRGSLRLRRAH
jgi:hypothetical protein